MLDELSRCSVFSNMDPNDLTFLARVATVRRFSKGAAIVRQFEPAENLYIITSGKATVRFIPYDGKEDIVMARVHQCSVVGWSAVLGNASYSSSVVCETEVAALAIHRDNLRALIRNYPEAGQQVLDRLAKSVSSRWKDAQMQVKSMLSEERGLSANIAASVKVGVRKMATSKPTKKEVQMRALVEQLSAYIEQFHGGSVEFVSYKGKTLKVRLGGACLGCPLSPSTLHGWVEGTVRQFFPEISKVEAVEP
jgi:CRP-like cAMP-binding protein